MRHSWIPLTLVFLTVAANAQERVPAAYTRFLIPLYAEQTVPGAFGSLWQTQLIIRNDGALPLDVFPISQTCASSSQCNTTVRGFQALGPKQDATVGNFPPLFARLGSGSLHGGFLYVERGGASQLSTHLTFADISRTPHAIVSLPVVAEDQFFDSTRSIVGVPIARSSRAALRIYADDPGGASFLLRIYLTTFVPGPPEDPFRFERPLVERLFTFAAPANECGFLHGCPPVQYQPAFHSVGNLLAEFPALEAAADVPNGVRIEIEPLSAGLRFWPMVTVTDDATSHTTVYTVR